MKKEYFDPRRLGALLCILAILVLFRKEIASAPPIYAFIRIGFVIASGVFILWITAIHAMSGSDRFEYARFGYVSKKKQPRLFIFAVSCWVLIGISLVIIGLWRFPKLF